MPTIRVFNPRRKRAKNPGASELFIVGNPKHMKHQRRRRRRHVNRHRRNPLLSSGRRHHRRLSHNRRYRRRNPLNLKNDAVLAVWASVGGIATRMGVQAFLSQYNSGVTGYAANAGMAIVLGWLASKFDDTAGTGVLVGGLAATVMRMASSLIQKSSGSSSSSGVSGLGGDREFALGDFQSTYFFEPSVNTGANQTVVPPPFAAYLPPPAPTKSGGLSGYNPFTLDRFSSRWS